MVAVTNPQKRKGSTFELEVARFLEANGFPYAARRFGAGAKLDRGDIDGIPGVVIEVKNHARIVLSEWVDEMRVEQANAGANEGIVVVKRKGKPVAESYVVTTLAEWARLNGDAGLAS